VNRFQQVRGILDNSVGGANTVVAGPHGAFWRNQNRDQFVAFKILGLPIVALGNGSSSNLVKALRGEAPFGQDIGTPGASIRRMPAGRDPVAADQIAFISAWIDDGCPEEVDAIGAVEAQLGGAPSGGAFLIVSDRAMRIPARLSLRTTDGSQGDVAVRVTPSSGATVEVSPTSVHISSATTEVDVVATTPSAGPNDTTIEVVQGPNVLASVTLTAISRPALRFRGSFQCRLATDPDPFDHPRGENSSFGVYAVEGPDAGNPDEPPLDRIVRFHDAVALRPFCDPIGVAVTAVEAQVGGTVTTFSVGDALIGEPVRLGPDCKFDGRNRTFAPDGFEPISDFRLEIGSVFSGASAAAVARPSPDDPPGSTAPYANGIVLLDADPAGGSPADFGISATTWAENAWTLLAFKLARLVAQQPIDERATRIRDRRVQEHVDTRPGHGLDAVATPLRLMERYTGLIDREVTTAADPQGALAYLASLPAIRVTADFLAFDTDCQTGKVTGTLDAPDEAGPGLAAPSDGAGTDRVAAPHVGLSRIPLDEQ
jgi:hypothetical protein